MLSTRLVSFISLQCILIALSLTKMLKSSISILLFQTRVIWKWWRSQSNKNHFLKNYSSLPPIKMAKAQYLVVFFTQRIITSSLLKLSQRTMETYQNNCHSFKCIGDWWASLWLRLTNSDHQLYLQSEQDFHWFKYF